MLPAAPMIRRNLRAATVILLAIFSAYAPAAAEDVALTFDDLPVFGKTVTTNDATAITRKLLRGLVANHLPATGFINEVKLEGDDRPERIALLTRWLDAGMDLGNHSYSHWSLTTTPVDAYIADVARGELRTRELLAARGRVPRWYRHPYLETGPSRAIRSEFEGWLTAHSYRVAPVTMENSDYLFALPYDDAIARGDHREARRIRAAYLHFTRAIIPWYREAALGLLGRRPAFVFLLHASRINADSIVALAKILHDDDLRPVTLDGAMTDPAYGIVDDYAGPNGDEWLTRWARTLHKDLPWASLPEPPAGIVAESARLDALPVVPLASPMRHYSGDGARRPRSAGGFRRAYTDKGGTL